ncbi:hypothetical protein N5J77_29665 [Sphingobium yanoikuyae]|jgi:hypothetical protein|uniref:Uncharacterized protein n=1 Tax=Sphingobium yanoikuyae TaxID=13690 RepID=A0AA42X1E9_SPHYA|nr:hypothetical protein [Sphingobium yanoikuyae]MDH2135295.1 hypothetical protein [Sphingobium yanoikuyae]MDH2153515.1 hypothetical protein [Sphingobium yanoikuyae]MDH2170643.1 hypothetical protein [Sphingobium yanoikuyae]
MTHPQIEQASHALVAEVQRQTTSHQAFYDPEGDFHLSATAMVRAVLASIRDPDSAMIDAGVFESGANPSDSVHRIWQAMIDVMLEGH